MNKRHNFFVSYHHELDENYKKIFELRFGNAFGAIIPGSVNDWDIDPNFPTDTIRQKIREKHLRDTSVTVVLIDVETWQRKHVDWEIGSSIRHTEYNHRTIPSRLHDTIESGFASIHNWSEDPTMVQDWIHQAYVRKSIKQPPNSRAPFGKNRTGIKWTD
jgi:hypothetical protein